MSEEKSKKILDGTVKIDKSQGEFVGRAGLTYQNDGFAAKQQVRQTLSEERARKILDGTIKIDKSQGEFVGRAGFTYQTEGFVAKQQVSLINKLTNLSAEKSKKDTACILKAKHNLGLSDNLQLLLAHLSRMFKGDL